MLYIALYMLLFVALAWWGRSIAIGVQRTERRYRSTSKPHSS